MLCESKDVINQSDNFNWVLTRVIIFELERSMHNLPIDEMYKVENLIKFHEKLENYEICIKLVNYKNICLNSNTK